MITMIGRVIDIWNCPESRPQPNVALSQPPWFAHAVEGTSLHH